MAALAKGRKAVACSLPLDPKSTLRHSGWRGITSCVNKVKPCSRELSQRLKKKCAQAANTSQAVNISSEEYSRQFSDILSRLVHSNDCEIVFLDGNTPRITSVNSISIQSDSTLLAQCACRQLRDAPVFFRPISQLWMIPRHELGSALQSASSIRPCRV